jgi:hypothetical protein
VDGYLRKTGIVPNERFEIDGIDAIAVMVDRGLGVSLLPDLGTAMVGSLAAHQTAGTRHFLYRSHRAHLGQGIPPASISTAFLEQAAAARAWPHTEK